MHIMQLSFEIFPSGMINFDLLSLLIQYMKLDDIMIYVFKQNILAMSIS